VRQNVSEVLYKEIPFLQFTTALICGILLGEKTGHSPLFLYLSLFLIIILALLLWITRKKIVSATYGIGVWILLMIAGISLYHSRINQLVTLPLDKSKYILLANDYPEKREKTFSLPTTIISRNGVSMEKNQNRMLIYLNDSSALSISPGDIISIDLYPILITDFDSTDSFDYQKYMIRKGYKYIAFPKEEFTIEARSRTLQTVSVSIKNSLLQRLSASGLQEDNLAVTAALTLGYRDLLQSEVTDNFRRSGITHILAVSGLHVGILSIIILSALSFINRKYDYIRVIITIIVIWIFALITGLSPSVTRASLMFTFLFTGRLLQRPANSLNSLLASAFLILVINPAMIFDVGFQLSYSAVLYILLFYKDLYSLIVVKNRFIDRLWAMVVITILAQLGTLPFVIYYFRMIPLLSVLTNFIAIPSAFIILGGGLLILLSSPLPLIPEITSTLVNITSSLLILVTEKVAMLQIASLTIQDVTVVSFIMLICLIPLLTFYLLKRGSIHLHLLLGSLILALIISIIQ
jgi:competence protein ComEC